MLLLSMFVWPKMGYVRGKIGWPNNLTGASREIICSPALTLTIGRVDNKVLMTLKSNTVFQPWVLV